MKFSYRVLYLIFTCTCNYIHAQTWDSVSSGIKPGIHSYGSVRAIIIFNNELIVGGGMDIAGGVPVNNIAAWNGSNWHSLDSGTTFSINAFAVYNNELFVGNTHNNFGIEKWNGIDWLSAGFVGDVVTALGVYNDSLYSGSYAGGNLKKWNGTSWSTVGNGLNGPVFSLAVYNGELYAGGWFHLAGNTPVSNIVKWNDSIWTDVGTGVNSAVWSLAIHNGELYAGGYFSSAGGNPANHIAKWNGVSWSALGAGIDSTVKTICSYNGKLYAGGIFSTAGGIPASNIACWNDTTWSAVGSGTDAIIYSSCAYNSELYIGGDFSMAGGIPAKRIARYRDNGIGILEINNPIKANVYPNPVSSSARIVLNHDVTEGTCKIINTAGSEVRRIPFTGDRFVVEKENLSGGIYFFTILSKESEFLYAGKIVFQ
jgi:hypothetical protein